MFVSSSGHRYAAPRPHHEEPRQVGEWRRQQRATAAAAAVPESHREYLCVTTGTVSLLLPAVQFTRFSEFWFIVDANRHEAVFL